MKSIEQHLAHYRQLGYVDVQTDSGTGSWVLVCRDARRVVKINQDPAYDKFVAFAQDTSDPSPPRIFLHEKPLGEFVVGSNDAYSVYRAGAINSFES